MLRVADEERDFQKEAFDEREIAEWLRQSKVQPFLSCNGGIAFRVWNTTPHPVEITGGQNFGEGHLNE